MTSKQWDKCLWRALWGLWVIAMKEYLVTACIYWFGRQLKDDKRYIGFTIDKIEKIQKRLKRMVNRAPEECPDGSEWGVIWLRDVELGPLYSLYATRADYYDLLFWCLENNMMVVKNPYLIEKYSL